MFILHRIIFGSYSLYESNAESSADIDIAFFLVNDSYDSQVISLEDVEPGDTTQVAFSVSNFYINDDNESIVADTDMEYSVKVRTTTNLPLEYSVTENQTARNADNNIALAESATDDFGTYFNTILEDSGEFIISDDDTSSDEYTNTYVVDITFPEDCNDVTYQNVIECIEISVEAEQIV